MTLTIMAGRFFVYLFVYCLVPLGVWASATFAGLWWSSQLSGPTGGRLGGAVFLFAVLFAYAVESGYKKHYVRGSKLYFCLVFALPIAIGLVLFVYGLWLKLV